MHNIGAVLGGYSLVLRLYFPAFFARSKISGHILLRAKKSWEVEPGNEARWLHVHVKACMVF